VVLLCTRCVCNPEPASQQDRGGGPPLNFYDAGTTSPRFLVKYTWTDDGITFEARAWRESKSLAVEAHTNQWRDPVSSRHWWQIESPPAPGTSTNVLTRRPAKRLYPGRCEESGRGHQEAGQRTTSMSFPRSRPDRRARNPNLRRGWNDGELFGFEATPEYL
jgi:hypothetical protein